MPCTVKAYTEGTYGKFPNVGVATQIILEYKPFVQALVNYLPTDELN